MMAKHCEIKYLTVLSRNDMFVFDAMLYVFRQQAIIAVITRSVHHTLALTIRAKRSKVLDKKGLAMTCFDTV